MTALNNRRYFLLFQSVAVSSLLMLGSVACGGDSESGGDGGAGASTDSGTSRGTGGSSGGGTSSGTGGSTGVSSGVDGSKVGETLEGDDAQLLCEAIVEYTETKTLSDAEACKAVGYIAGASVITEGDEAIQAACTVAEEACEEAEPEVEEESSECEDIPETLSECTATVSEIETCMAEYIDAQFNAVTDSVAAIPSCNDMVVADYEDVEQSEADMPSSCDVVEDDCPVVLEMF